MEHYTMYEALHPLGSCSYHLSPASKLHYERCSVELRSVELAIRGWKSMFMEVRKD